MKKDKKIIILVVCIIIILVAMISLFIANLNHKDDIDKTTTTTTTTEKIIKSKTIKDNTYNLSVYFDNFEYDDSVKLVVKKVDNVPIENVVNVYDIELVDSTNNKIDINNADIQISIPFDNKDNYTNFKVLYLGNNNEVLDTIDANYINGNVVFKTTHLSRYAIVATKVEEKPQQEQTTIKRPTTKPTTVQPKPNTTQSTTPKPTTTTTTTTKKVTTSTTTTQKVKSYSIKVRAVDQYSPDRILSVYENGNMISVAAVKYNGTILCSGDNMVVNMYEIEGMNELTVILKDGKSITAKIQ